MARSRRRGADAVPALPCPKAPSRCRAMSRRPPCWRAASPRSASWPTRRPAARLAPALAQGQRLVSRDGALWRWDGFTIAAGAPTAAAVRLSQRNRQAELAGELAEAKRDPERGRGRLRRGAQRRARGHRRATKPAARPCQAAYRAADQARQARDRGAGPAPPSSTAGSRPWIEAAAAADASLAESEQESAARGRGARRVCPISARPARRLASSRRARREAQPSDRMPQPADDACAARRRPGASA